nr:ATP-binding cassette domain-containing protein [Pseudomonadota bacterium]
MTPLLTTKGLSRSYGGLKAVDKVDFALMPGEIRAIIGPNGAGKTTFVSLVCGRVEPSAGTIVFDGSDITALPAHQRVRRGIAYTFQITSVFANLTAYDNVALPVQRTLADGRGHGAVHAAVMAALARVGLAGRESMVAGTLSYGHQ